MVNEIKFAHRYSKMDIEFDGNPAMLLAVGIHKIEDLPPKFLDYDAHYFYWDNDELVDSYYQFPKASKVLVLCLVGKDGIPFTSIRKFDEEKNDYYNRKIGEHFILRLEEVEP